jgi:hypothetical protein
LCKGCPNRQLLQTGTSLAPGLELAKICPRWAGRGATVAATGRPQPATDAGGVPSGCFAAIPHREPATLRGATGNHQGCRLGARELPVRGGELLRKRSRWGIAQNILTESVPPAPACAGCHKRNLHQNHNQKSQEPCV